MGNNNGRSCGTSGSFQAEYGRTGFAVSTRPPNYFLSVHFVNAYGVLTDAIDIDCNTSDTIGMIEAKALQELDTAGAARIEFGLKWGGDGDMSMVERGEAMCIRARGFRAGWAAHTPYAPAAAAIHSHLQAHSHPIDAQSIVAHASFGEMDAERERAHRKSSESGGAASGSGSDTSGSGGRGAHSGVLASRSFALLTPSSLNFLPDRPSPVLATGVATTSAGLPLAPPSPASLKPRPGMTLIFVSDEPQIDEEGDRVGPPCQHYTELPPTSRDFTAPVHIIT